MRGSAPPEIATQFEEVLDAVATSVGRLAPDAKAAELLDPLPGKEIFGVVHDYDCG